MFEKKQYWEMPATREDIRKLALALEIKNSQEVLKQDVALQVVSILLQVLTASTKKEHVCTIR